jgi:hypothetical protein
VNAHRILALSVSLPFTLASAASHAQPEPPFSRPWAPSNSAMSVAARRYELGLFAPSRYGIRDDLELSTHALFFLLLPQATLKLRFYEQSAFAIAARGRVAYPTLFLKAISKSGAFGLLPETTDPPQAIEMGGDVLASWLFAREHAASVWIGFSAAPRTSSDDFPLLDFPFLYPRFASLYTAIVPRSGVAFNGRIFGELFYGVDLRAYLLPLSDVEGGFALEQGLSLEYHASAHVAIELALRTSYARYPIGLRTHFLPLFDLKIGF